MEVRGRGRRDAGGIVFGAILLLVGGYYLLQQTFGLNLPDLNWDQTLAGPPDRPRRGRAVRRLVQGQAGLTDAPGQPPLLSASR